jgi:hypothetical protein
MISTAGEIESVPVPHLISVEFFSFKGKKSDELINNTLATNAKPGRSVWFSYDFTTPVYLTGLKLICDGYDSWNEFELEVRHVDGTTHEEKISVNQNEVELKLGKLCNGFRFRPEARMLAKTTIKSVQATGFTLAEFHEFELAIREFDKRNLEFNERVVRHATLQAEIGEYRAQKSNLESEIGKSRAEAEQLQVSIAEQTILVSKQKELLKDIDARLAILKGDQRTTQADVAGLEKKRDEIVREIRLFPSEIAGFVREGDRNIRWYIGICLPFVIILSIIVYSMFSSAVDLTQIWKLDEGADVWTIFLTRIPFVLLAVAIIEVCGYIVGRLIFEIVRINRQRLDFSKLSIIAKDVSAASSSGLSMSDAEIFENETKLKMELLREHMKNYTGSEFEYKGSALVSAIAGVAERIAAKKE